MDYLEYPHFNIVLPSIDTIKSVMVNRKEELSLLLKALIDWNHNVLMYGAWGVGKTFLVKVVKDKIDSKSNDCIVVQIDFLGENFNLLDEKEGPSNFPLSILLLICTNIWKKLFNKKYRELKESLYDKSNIISISNKPENILKKIYAHLMQLDTKVIKSKSGSVGFSAGAKGDIGELYQKETTGRSILPFEFFEYIEELQSDVLSKYGKNKIIVLCDEANNLPIYQQEEILNRYLEIFKERKVQFLFVAGHMRENTLNKLPACFETQIEIKGFSKSKYISDLIEKTDKNKVIEFHDQSIEILFEYFKGNPRLTLVALRDAIKFIAHDKTCEVLPSIMTKACKEIEENIRHHRGRIY